MALAQMVKLIGFETAMSSVLDVLTDVSENYVKDITASLKAHTDHCELRRI